MPMPEVLLLDFFSFRALLRDAVIWNHSGSKAGREWLRNAYDLTQTELDLPALVKKFGRGGSYGGT